MMDNPVQECSRNDKLNDSWVHLQPQQGLVSSQEAMGMMEKLLLEAQKESRDTSQAHSIASSLGSSRGSPHHSPKGPHSPKTETLPLLVSTQTTQLQGVRLSSIVQREVDTEFVWDWSSRPEALPASDLGKKFNHPSNGRHRAGVYNKGVLAELSSLSFKSKIVLFLTHTGTLVVAGLVGAIIAWLRRPNEELYDL